MRLNSVRIRNFKAIVDSKTVTFGPLTALIGNNGSGKSSLIEAMETYQCIVRDDLDVAMQRWFGFEYVHYQGARKLGATIASGRQLNPMQFDFRLHKTKTHLAVNSDPALNQYFIQAESITEGKQTMDRGNLFTGQLETVMKQGRSMLAFQADYAPLARFVADWQFLTLQPEHMGIPQPQRRTGGKLRLARDGSNIAEYLLDIRNQDPRAFAGIFDALRFVLPYALDVQPAITTELQRKAFLQLTEADFTVPGWLLSTGTLRILALLALLRHPSPPPLIVIEEIENGLDPRSIHLLVEEIRNAVLDGVTQVILTTHSPYLLDLLTLDHLVLVERDAKGQPRFLRPADNANLQRWAEDFAPGKLYTMGSLTGDKV